MNFTSSGRNIQELWTKNVRNTGTNFQYVLLKRTNAFLIARSETVDKAFHFLAAMKTFALLDYPSALSLVEGGKIQKCVGIAHQRHAEAERQLGLPVCVHKYHLGYIFRRLFEKIRPQSGSVFFHIVSAFVRQGGEIARVGLTADGPAAVGLCYGDRAGEAAVGDEVYDGASVCRGEAQLCAGGEIAAV